MDIKEIRKEELDEIIAKSGFDYDLTVKDYYIIVLLYLIKDIEGIYFKGGTAIQKTILNHSRLSEDIDFTLERPLKDVREEIEKKINDSKIFKSIIRDKDVEGFVRLVVSYNTDFGKDVIFIDLNERGKIFTKPETIEIKHFYPNIPKFSFPCLSRDEMVAEKVAAAIGRNRPRDHYDVYKMIKEGIKINMKLVEKKCKQSGNEFNIVKMFNKAKKLHKRWNDDMIPLLVDEVGFEEVMKTLADYFNLKEEKG